MFPEESYGRVATITRSFYAAGSSLQFTIAFLTYVTPLVSETACTRSRVTRIPSQIERLREEFSS